MLKNFDLRWHPEAALTVVMAANGYPGSYAKGSVIEGIDAAAAVGKTVGEAQQRAYTAIDRIRWIGGFCRRDIGFRAVEREKRDN